MHYRKILYRVLYSIEHHYNNVINIILYTHDIVKFFKLLNCKKLDTFNIASNYKLVYWSLSKNTRDKFIKIQVLTKVNTGWNCELMDLFLTSLGKVYGCDHVFRANWPVYVLARFCPSEYEGKFKRTDIFFSYIREGR